MASCGCPMVSPWYQTTPFLFDGHDASARVLALLWDGSDYPWISELLKSILKESQRYLKNHSIYHLQYHLWYHLYFPGMNEFVQSFWVSAAARLLSRADCWWRVRARLTPVSLWNEARRGTGRLWWSVRTIAGCFITDNAKITWMIKRGSPMT